MDVADGLITLRTRGTGLSSLADALERSTRATPWDDEEVGHRRVAAALQEVADSWDDERELLSRSMREVAEVAEVARASADTFEQVDEDLARAVRDALEER